MKARGSRGRSRPGPGHGLGGSGARTAVGREEGTVQDADQILVLDDGRITASGTHARLMAEGGLYAHLARTQLLPAAEDDRSR